MCDFQKPAGSFISYFSNLVKQQGGINLAQGIPGFEPPKLLLNELQNLLMQSVHQYAPGIGNFKLLEILAKQYKVSKANLLIVQGATESLSLIYTYLNRKITGNYSVLSFEPAYESYLNLPKIFGQKFIPFSLNGDYSFDYDYLARTIKENNVKLVFVSSPGNPFGKIFSRKELDNLILLSTELDFYLVLDIVYETLYFDKPPYIPIDKLNSNLFFVSSFSKMFCITGWRIGYLIADKCHMEGIKSIHDYIGLCAPSLLQEALARYLESNNFGSSFLENLRTDVKKSFDILSKTLNEVEFFIPPIQGGCFIWARLPSGWDDGFTFACDLYKKHGVAVIPGEHFSMNTKRWIRFNIARPEKEIVQACESLKSFYVSQLFC